MLCWGSCSPRGDPEHSPARSRPTHTRWLVMVHQLGSCAHLLLLSGACISVAEEGRWTSRPATCTWRTLSKAASLRNKGTPISKRAIRAAGVAQYGTPKAAISDAPASDASSASIAASAYAGSAAPLAVGVPLCHVHMATMSRGICNSDVDTSCKVV